MQKLRDFVVLKLSSFYFQSGNTAKVAIFILMQKIILKLQQCCRDPVLSDPQGYYHSSIKRFHTSFFLFNSFQLHHLSIEMEIV